MIEGRGRIKLSEQLGPFSFIDLAATYLELKNKVESEQISYDVLQKIKEKKSREMIIEKFSEISFFSRDFSASSYFFPFSTPVFYYSPKFVLEIGVFLGFEEISYSRDIRYNYSRRKVYYKKDGYYSHTIFEIDDKKIKKSEIVKKNNNKISISMELGLVNIFEMFDLNLYYHTNLLPLGIRYGVY